MAMQIPGVSTDAWKTVKGLIADTVGPMAVLAIGAQKFVSITASAVLNAEKLKRALAASQGAEQLRKQFEVLGLSAEQARKKVEGVAKVASGSAFSFESLASAAKNLQVLGGSALSTAGMLRKVQDVAAATGSPVDNVATAIGEMYAALERGGDGAGAAASQLASMGAISQATAQKISQISAAGGPAADSLRAMQSDLAKANGASAQMASSLSGLQAQLANLQNENDIKIGDMMLEGEKAGYRAAIAMEKLRGKVDEVASAPFAAIIGQFSKLKEAIANVLGSDQGIEAIKGLFTFLSTVAVAAMGVVIAQVIQFVAFLGGLAATALKTAAGVKTLSGALSFAGGALKNWGTLLASATVRMNLYAAAITLVVAKVLEARAAIDAMADAQKNLNQTNAKELGGLKQKRLMVSTPEEKQAAMKDFNASISANDEGVSAAKQELQAAQAEQKKGVNFFLKGGLVEKMLMNEKNAKVSLAQDKVMSLEQQGRGLRAERGRLAAMDSTTLGLDNEQDQRERAKLQLEDDIRKNSRQRAAGMASPAQASGLIESELWDANNKLQQSEKASQRSFEERGNLYTAQAGALVAGDAGTKDFSAKGYSDSLDAVKQLDMQTESGRLSKDLAIRETLRDERASTEGAIAQQVGLGAAADPETRKRLLEKRNVINEQIQSIGGEGEISGRRTQELKRQRERAMEKEDPVKARQEVEAVKARKQQVDEAKAADAASIEAGNRKLTLEKRLAAIRGLEGGESQSAGLAGDEELNNLKERLKATQEVEAATAKFNASSQADRPQAEAELDKVRVAAKGRGFRDGDTSASINLEISGVKQITELRKQQAAIEEAAARRRRDEILQELKVRQQMAQIELDRAGGRSSKKNEFDVRQEDRDKQRADLKKAEALVAQRDAASDPDVIQALKAQLRGLGQDEGVTAEDIKSKQKSLNLDEASDRTNVREALRGAAIGGQLAIARAQEEYGPTQDAQFKGKVKREELEDKLGAERKTAEYQKGGMGQKDAENMAAYDQRRERIAARLEEAGNQRVDSLTAVGGGATAMVGPVADTASLLKELNKINEQQGDLLAKILKKSEDQEALVRPLINGNK